MYCTAVERQIASRVDVDCDPTSGSAQRFVSVIDTGSTRTLVTSALMDRLNVEFSKATDSGGNIVCLDGSPLPVLGVAKLVMSRMDGPQCPVVIPAISVEALVLLELSVVAADVLIGSDFFTSCGGLHLEHSDDGSLVGVTFARAAMMDVDAEVAASTVESALPGSVCGVEQKLTRHIAVEHDGEDVVLSVDDGEVRWCGSEGHWVARWRWADGNAPGGNIGYGVAEYSRSRLSAEQEEKFSAAVDEWVENSWLVDHDTDKHGAPACVLPLIAVLQEHKQSTPVRPVLDYRCLNEHIVCPLGADSPVCEEKLRTWRKAGEAGSYNIIDIKKAYLQVRIAPDLLRFQVVSWRGEDLCDDPHGVWALGCPETDEQYCSLRDESHA